MDACWWGSSTAGNTHSSYQNMEPAKTRQNHLQPPTKPAKRTQNHLQYTLYDRFVWCYLRFVWCYYHVDDRPDKNVLIWDVYKRTRQKHIECIVCMFHKNEGLLRYSSVFPFATLQLAINILFEDKSIGSDMKILCQNCQEDNYSWYWVDISMSWKKISAGLFSARAHALTFRESFDANFRIRSRKFHALLPTW